MSILIEQYIKVAGVLSDTKLVINKGEKDGIKKGFVFKIFSSSDINIIDPDTNNNLGKLNDSKATVKVINVKENFSVCESFVRNDSNFVTPNIIDFYRNQTVRFLFDENSIFTPNKLPVDIITIGDIAIKE
jgi:hypothetical protein